MSDIIDHLDTLAEQIALHAIGDNVDLKTKIESFKALANFQFNKNNPKKNPKEDDENADSFASFRERVASATDSGESNPD
jgi:hypothetical protein